MDHFKWTKCSIWNIKTFLTARKGDQGSVQIKDNFLIISNLLQIRLIWIQFRTLIKFICKAMIQGKIFNIPEYVGAAGKFLLDLDSWLVEF